MVIMVSYTVYSVFAYFNFYYYNSNYNNYSYYNLIIIVNSEVSMRKKRPLHLICSQTLRSIARAEPELLVVPRKRTTTTASV